MEAGGDVKRSESEFPRGPGRGDETGAAVIPGRFLFWLERPRAQHSSGGVGCLSSLSLSLFPSVSLSVFVSLSLPERREDRRSSSLALIGRRLVSAATSERLVRVEFQ